MKRSLLMMLAVFLLVQVAGAAPVTVDLWENFPNSQGRTAFTLMPTNMAVRSTASLTASEITPLALRGKTSISPWCPGATPPGS